MAEAGELPAMKNKILFLAKALGCSLVLFGLWRHLAKGHATLVEFLLNLGRPAYRQLQVPANIAYYDSIPLIILVSLVLATPGLRIARRGLLILIGILAFALLNASRLRLGLNPSDTTAWLAYGGIKTFLPFAIWIGGAFGRIGEMFAMLPRRPPVAVTGLRCPLCRESHDDIRGHLLEAHGEHCLRIKKVKRLLTANPASGLKQP